MSDEPEDHTDEEATEVLEHIEHKDDMYLVLEDTPINKATLTELQHDQQIKFIEALHDRRTRFNVAVTKAKAAKGKSIEQQNLAKAMKFEKLTEKLEKELAKVDKALAKCDEFADELKVMRLTMGDKDE